MTSRKPWHKTLIELRGAESQVMDLNLILTLLAAVGGLGGLSTIIVVAYWLGKKFTQIDARFERLEERVSRLEERLSGLERRMLSLFVDFAQTIRAVHEFMLEVFCYEGLLRREAASLIRTELRTHLDLFLTRLHLTGSSNPLTREELQYIVKRIRELLDKEELTYEEAQELKQLALRLCEEYGREYPDLWKIYWYAVMWVGLSLRLQMERRKQ